MTQYSYYNKNKYKKLGKLRETLFLILLYDLIYLLFSVNK